MKRYHPLTYNDAKARKRKIVNDVCSKCERKMGMGTDDPCFKCPWKALMDEVMGNGNGHV